MNNLPHNQFPIGTCTFFPASPTPSPQRTRMSALRSALRAIPALAAVALLLTAPFATAQSPVDEQFNPSADSEVDAIAVQPDGKILVGGLNKWSSRVSPGFMLEEECHRNFAFTMYHADQMPELEFGRVEVAPVGAGGPGLWRVRAEIRNTRLIPTRSSLRRRERIGWPDLLECDPGPGGASVLAVNAYSNWLDQTPEPRFREPGRVLVGDGVPGREARVFEFTVQGAEGQSVMLRYTSQWARTIQQSVELRAKSRP